MDNPRALIAAALMAVPAQFTEAQTVQVCTDMGRFTIELAAEAPRHRENFLRLINEGFYNGTVFHRVVEGVVVQGGGFDRNLARRPAGDSVVNESSNGLGNERGTVAAARLREADSATSQFFVNLVDNDDLNATSRRPGYTVFGRVTSGMDVIDEIGRLPTGAAGPLPREVPDPLVVIESMSVVGADAGGAATTVPEETETSTASEESVLAQVDAIHAACGVMAPDMLVAEARAALDSGQIRRSRFALENYFAISPADDPLMTEAQTLFRALPRNEQSGVQPIVAHCAIPDDPIMPNGRRASLEEMQEAQAQVREFLSSSEAYLECLSDVIDGGSLDDAQEVALVALHNETISRMEMTAESFNSELREYRDRD